MHTATALNVGQTAHVHHAQAPGPVLVVCEHASNRIPAVFEGLGLDTEARESHIAWDPGALGVARDLAAALSSDLVFCDVSRLIYDCNRPPEAPSAMPARSERYDIPGNAHLTAEDRAARVKAIYEPFRTALAGKIAARRAELDLMVTVHSFTPTYNGTPRSVELGLLHGQDARFAKAMLAERPAHVTLNTQLNAPYSAADGVAHTLDLHGSANGLHNVMLEIRNDLIETPAQQAAMARLLAPWITATRARIGAEQVI